MQKLHSEITHAICYNCAKMKSKHPNSQACAWLYLENSYCQELIEIDEKIQTFQDEHEVEITLGLDSKFRTDDFWQIK